jgi:tetratricopeptide (TPR) repeat protein
MTLLAELMDRVRKNATGALEWQDGARRRLFFFSRGELVLVQSNLKSESTERVRERYPDESVEQVAARLGLFRLEAALQDDRGTTRWNDGAPAPRREKVDLVGAILRSDTPLEPVSGFPRAVRGRLAALSALPIEPLLRDYLRDLDGERPAEEVVAFAPAPPAATDRALAMAVLLGAVEDSTSGGASAIVTAVPDARRNAGGIDDIMGMISEEVGGASEPRAAAVASVTDADDELRRTFGPTLQRIRNAGNHFETLGVGPDDAPETIRRVYFGLARELHPDRFAGASEPVQVSASELFNKVRAAWEVLGDDAKRQAYIAKVVRGEKTEDERAMDKVRDILDAEGEFKRGLNEFNAGRITQAWELFSAAAAKVPEEPQFAAYAGFTTFKLFYGRDQARAEAGERQLIEAMKQLETTFDAGWVLLGLVERIRGNDASARRAFVAALRMRPSNADALREMKRLERTNEAAPEKSPAGGFLKGLFGRKK